MLCGCFIRVSSASVWGNLYFSVQMMCRSSQDLALALGVSPEPKSLFLGVWWHSLLNLMGSFREFEKEFFWVSFLMSKFPSWKVWCLRWYLLKVYCEKVPYVKKHDYFLVDTVLGISAFISCGSKDLDLEGPTAMLLDKVLGRPL